MLSPNSRSLYTSALTPPPGMVFDQAVATTFSLDPIFLLGTPLYLAALANGKQTEPDPVALYESIRRYSDQISVYVQKSRILVSKATKPSPLFGLLEKMIVEVNAPGEGVFHPKIWLIRFLPIHDSEDEPMFRLVVLSRNQTLDNSWDISLQLEGTVPDRRRKAVNNPLAFFLRQLPTLADPLRIVPEKKEQIDRIAEEIEYVDWELPGGYDKLNFFLSGFDRFGWKMPAAKRSLVVSPFCSDEILREIAERTEEKAFLISRPETLNGLSSETRNQFEKCRQLNEAAETEDGEESELDDDRISTTGLHAKVFVFETSSEQRFVMGSANATVSALKPMPKATRNVEFLVELIGKPSKVGKIEKMLDSDLEDGLGRFLEEFSPSDKDATDAARHQAEQSLEKARRVLSKTPMSLTCRKNEEKKLWSLFLHGNFPRLEGVAAVKVWPITLAEDGHAVTVLPMNDSEVWFGDLTPSALTGLTAFHLTSEHEGVSVRFVLNLPIEGVPENERKAAIVQTVIENQEGFIRYLLLLLDDPADDYGMSGSIGTRFKRELMQMAAGEEVPLLEGLTRSFARHSERLDEVAAVIRDLRSSEDGRKIVPEKLLKLWSVFEEALRGRDD